MKNTKRIISKTDLLIVRINHAVHLGAMERSTANEIFAILRLNDDIKQVVTKENSAP